MSNMTTTEYRNLLDIITADRELPEGFDSWGIKSVHPDLITTMGFRWALPGGLNISNDALNRKNTDACPTRQGDGLCVATSWRGMASGGIPARTLLLVAYREEDVVGRDIPQGKLRIGGVVASVALVDGERLIREYGRDADLIGANLIGANLVDANLQGANLRDANLQSADLQYADLQYADLRCAKLQCADLQYADLQGADLQGANLRDANLRGANLQSVNLRSAGLRGAILRCADLRGADLRGADLQGADLSDADLRDANLRGANLQSVNLRSAGLREADMRGANLLGADLKQADLRGADLLRAYVGEDVPPIGWESINGHLSKKEEGNK